MSRHEGVSCDLCFKSNFSGRRYKCLMCYDYDLCANCYEEGATSTRHLTEHPMQCILTRADFELYYAGEVLGAEHPQSFTCPYCKKMGFSDSGLIDHVGSEHTDAGLEVVCPLCAAMPGGEPNLVTDDFAGHLNVEHRTGGRDLITFLDEPSAIRHGGVRRIPHSGRALGGPRSRRSNMHFSSAGALSALSPAGRDSVDPIAELLSQLSGVRRGAPQPSQLSQLQMQIQLERQQVSAGRHQLERLPRRAQPVVSLSSTSVIGNTVTTSAASASTQQAQLIGGISSSNIVSNGRDITITSNPLQLAAAAAAAAASSSGSSSIQSQTNQSQFLLSRFMSPPLVESEQIEMEVNRADRAQYIQDLLLTSLSNIQITQNLPKESPTLDVVEDSAKLKDANLEDDTIDVVIDGMPVQNVQQQQQHGGVGGGGVGANLTKHKSASTTGKSVQQQQQNLGADRRSRPPSSIKNRELKSNTMQQSTKDSPDSR